MTNQTCFSTEMNSHALREASDSIHPGRNVSQAGVEHHPGQTGLHSLQAARAVIRPEKGRVREPGAKHTGVASAHL